MSHPYTPMPAANPIVTDRGGQIDVLALIDHFVLGGAETLLARFAVAAPRAGVRLSVACLHELDGNPAARPLIELGRPPVNFNLVGRPGLETIRAVREHIVRTRAQILHTHLGTSDLVGCIAARSLGVPVVSTVHTTDWGTTRRHRWRSEVERRIVKLFAARVIAVSESAREQYLRRGWGREDQVVTILNGIDVTSTPGAGAEVRRELGLAAEDLVVTMVSALRPEKAHDVAIDALRILQPRFPNLRLLIAGQGQLRDEIVRRSAGLGGAVVLAGLRNDVMPIFDAADICLHPSRREALPTTIIEAMAASVPVIATDVGGIPEILTDPKLGMLVPAPPEAGAIAAALSSLLERPQCRRAMGSAGRQAYEARFTADPWVRRTRALYDTVLAETNATQHRSSRVRGLAPGLSRCVRDDH
jgi:glycosyltransferase involved in cell wall biosynthesis